MQWQEDLTDLRAEYLDDLGQDKITEIGLPTMQRIAELGRAFA
jgi:hypothetical protein